VQEITYPSGAGDGQSPWQSPWQPPWQSARGG